MPEELDADVRVVNTVPADDSDSNDSDSGSSGGSSSSSSNDDTNYVSDENTAEVTLTDVQGEDGYRKTEDELAEDLASGNTENLSQAEENTADNKNTSKIDTLAEDLATTSEVEKQADANLTDVQGEDGFRKTEEELRQQIANGEVENLEPAEQPSKSAVRGSLRNRRQQLNQKQAEQINQQEVIEAENGVLRPKKEEKTPPLNQVLEENPVQVTNPLSGETFTPEGENIQRALAGFETITGKDSLEFLAAGLTGGDTDKVVAESIQRQGTEDEDFLGEAGEFIQSGPGLILGGKGLTGAVSKTSSAIGSLSTRAASTFETGAAATGAGLLSYEVGYGTGEIAQGNTQEGVEKFLGAGLATAGAAGRTPRALKSTPDLKVPTEKIKVKAEGLKDFASGDLGYKTTDSGIIRRGGRPRSDLEEGVIPESPTKMRTVEQDDGRIVQEFFIRESTGDVRGFRIREPRTRRGVAKEKIVDRLTNTRKGQARLKAKQRTKQKQKQKQKSSSQEEDVEVIDIDERIAKMQALRKINALKPSQTDVAAAGFSDTPEAVNEFAETDSDTFFIGGIPQQDQQDQLDLSQELNQDLGQELDQGIGQDQGVDDQLDQLEDELIDFQQPQETEIGIQENPPVEETFQPPEIIQEQPPEIIQTRENPPENPPMFKPPELEVPDFGNESSDEEEELGLFDVEQDTEFATSLAGEVFNVGVTEEQAGEQPLTGLEARINEDPTQSL